MVQQYVNSVASYMDAFRMIQQLRLWRYIWIPGLISLTLGLLLFAFSWKLSTGVGAWMMTWWPWKAGLKLLAGILSLFGKLLSPLIGFIGFKNLVPVFSAPFMAELSERVEMKVLGKHRSLDPVTPERFLRDMRRGIRQGYRNFFREAMHTMMAMATGILPLVGSLSFLLVFFVQAYYAGVSNLSFTLERHLSEDQSEAFIREHRAMTTGNGTVYIGMLAIPFIGFVFAPSFSTVAATIESLRLIAPDERRAVESEYV